MTGSFSNSSNSQDLCPCCDRCVYVDKDSASGKMSVCIQRRGRQRVCQRRVATVSMEAIPLANCASKASSATTETRGSVKDRLEIAVTSTSIYLGVTICSTLLINYISASTFHTTPDATISMGSGLILYHPAGCGGLLACLCLSSRDNCLTFKCLEPASVKHRLV